MKDTETSKKVPPEIYEKALELLKDAGQTKVLQEMDSWQQSARDKFVKTLVELDKITPTGFVKYCHRARKLLGDSSKNINPYDQYKPQVPTGYFLRPGETQFDEFEAEGLKELSKIGFVLIAGGLGERLGYSDIKIKLPFICIEEHYSYMKYYADFALACRDYVLKTDPTVDKDSFYVPFCIMTSDTTYERTIEYLENNDYFGLGKDRVDIVR